MARLIQLNSHGLVTCSWWVQVLSRETQSLQLWLYGTSWTATKTSFASPWSLSASSRANGTHTSSRTLMSSWQFLRNATITGGSLKICNCNTKKGNCQLENQRKGSETRLIISQPWLLWSLTNCTIQSILWLEPRVDTFGSQTQEQTNFYSALKSLMISVEESEESSRHMLGLSLNLKMLQHFIAGIRAEKTVTKNTQRITQPIFSWELRPLSRLTET